MDRGLPEHRVGANLLGQPLPNDTQLKQRGEVVGNPATGSMRIISDVTAQKKERCR